MDELEIVARRAPFDYSEGFYQQVHLATPAGINRAAANEAATLGCEPQATRRCHR